MPQQQKRKHPKFRLPPKQKSKNDTSSKSKTVGMQNNNTGESEKNLFTGMAKTIIRHVKNRKTHRLFPLLSAAFSVWFGMKVSPLFGAICFMATIYLVLVIFVPWESILNWFGKVNKALIQYLVPCVLCLIIALPTWNKIVDIFPNNQSSRINITPSNEPPTFVNGDQEINVSMGHIIFRGTVLGLTNTPHNFNVGTNDILIIFIKNNKLYVDTNLYVNNSPSVALEGNILVSKPQGWDMNNDNNCMEVVDNNQKPIFHLTYKTPYDIVISGYLSFPGGYLYIDDNGNMNSSGLSPQFIENTLPLKRLFKYPSSENQGIREGGITK